MNTDTQAPTTGLQQWGLNRLRIYRRALHGINELLRMSRHAGTAYIRPVTPNRTVVVYRPENRFLQPVIVRCGRCRITNTNADGLGSHFALPVTVGAATPVLRIGGDSLLRTERDSRNREFFVVADAHIRFAGLDWLTDDGTES